MTGRTGLGLVPAPLHPHAAMEPGRDDREDSPDRLLWRLADGPQWSPVVMTGRTTRLEAALKNLPEPPQWSPVVMTGRTPSRLALPGRTPSRNGARS